ncbi:MAG: Fic family protein [Ruminiclostridium sp.]
MKKCIKEGLPLDEKIVKDIHALVMENIIVGSIYRNEEVAISGASHTPPARNEMYVQTKNFFADLMYKKDLNPIELAAWSHVEFVRIHPFQDGNGRTSRLIMNYQLMSCGFLPVSIAKENRLDYYNVLDKYAAEGILDDFADMLAELEEVQLDKYITIIPEQGQSQQIQQIHQM